MRRVGWDIFYFHFGIRYYNVCDLMRQFEYQVTNYYVLYNVTVKEI